MTHCNDDPPNFFMDNIRLPGKRFITTEAFSEAFSLRNPSVKQAMSLIVLLSLLSKITEKSIIVH